MAASIASQRVGLERAEALGEPGGAPLAHRAEEPLALGRQLEPDAPTVDVGPHPDEQACALEPVDVARRAPARRSPRPRRARAGSARGCA